MYDGVELRYSGAVATIMLDRPDAANAIDIPLARALMKAAIEVDQNNAVRCVVLTGAGRFFCVGGDIRAFVVAGDGIGDYLKEITSYLHSAIATLAHMKKPFVTAINGACGGAGVGLALLGDIVLMGSSAVMTLGYSKIGLTPDAGATWLLPRLVGLRQAQELCLRNSKVDATTAVRRGLVTRVVENEFLADEAIGIATELAQGPTGAFGAIRFLLAQSSECSLETQLEAERIAIATAGKSADCREGIDAFLDKRDPQFDRK